MSGKVTSSGPPAIPVVSGATGEGGHFAEFCANPALFLSRAYRENGEVSQFDLNGLTNVLLVSPEAHEAMFRAPDELLNAAQAYQMMVPVFGEGVQYGAPPELERQQLKIQARGLRQDRMQLYAAVIAREVEDWLQDWGEEGELDIYQAFTRLTLKTSTHCLMGEEFRYTLTDEFADLYHELEHSVSPAAHTPSSPVLHTTPPVSSSVITPILYNSMAAASVEPNEMGSNPCSLHTKPA